MLNVKEIDLSYIDKIHYSFHLKCISLCLCENEATGKELLEVQMIIFITQILSTCSESTNSACKKFKKYIFITMKHLKQICNLNNSSYIN